MCIRSIFVLQDFFSVVFEAPVVDGDLLTWVSYPNTISFSVLFNKIVIQSFSTI